MTEIRYDFLVRTDIPCFQDLQKTSGFLLVAELVDDQDIADLIEKNERIAGMHAAVVTLLRHALLILAAAEVIGDQDSPGRLIGRKIFVIFSGIICV